MALRHLSLLLALLLLASSVAAVPQGRGQQLTPQQQQQLFQQQQLQRQQHQRRLQQGQQQQQQQQVITGSFDISLVPENHSLTEVTDEGIQVLLASEESVKIFVDCFITPSKCPSRSVLNLIKQVRLLGMDGWCKTCPEQHQKEYLDRIYNFVSGFINRYPDQWRRLLPHLGSVIAVLPSNVRN